MNPLFLAIVVFLGVSTLVAAVVFLLQGGSETKAEDRLAMLTGASSAVGGKDGVLKESSVLTQPLDATQGMIAEFLARFRNLSLMFEQANVTISPARFFGICGIVGLGGTVAAFVAGLHPGLAPVAGLLASLLPPMWLVMRRKRRFKAFATPIARRDGIGRPGAARRTQPGVRIQSGGVGDGGADRRSSFARRSRSKTWAFRWTKRCAT